MMLPQQIQTRASCQSWNSKLSSLAAPLSARGFLKNDNLLDSAYTFFKELLSSPITEPPLLLSAPHPEHTPASLSPPPNHPPKAHILEVLSSFTERL